MKHKRFVLLLQDALAFQIFLPLRHKISKS